MSPFFLRFMGFGVKLMGVFEERYRERDEACRISVYVLRVAHNVIYGVK